MQDDATLIIKFEVADALKGLGFLASYGFEPEMKGPEQNCITFANDDLGNAKRWVVHLQEHMTENTFDAINTADVIERVAKAGVVPIIKLESADILLTEMLVKRHQRINGSACFFSA